MASPLPSLARLLLISLLLVTVFEFSLGITCYKCAPCFDDKSSWPTVECPAGTTSCVKDEVDYTLNGDKINSGTRGCAGIAVQQPVCTNLTETLKKQGATDIKKAEICHCNTDKCNDGSLGGGKGLEAKAGWIILLGVGGVVIANLGML